ncbi:Uncharacterized protein CTYZ_00000388 [Cryptosporidium tyzzeri]|nr:Uncharacterized protein CTYZ_00000388 [Cryptosporidium tyzzeri]
MNNFQEKVINYLPLFSDDKISIHFIEICGEAGFCLKPRSFYEINFIRFKSKFNPRIQEVYHAIPPLEGALNFKVFARCSTLYSQFFF